VFQIFCFGLKCVTTKHFNRFQHVSTSISTDLMNISTFFINLKGVEIMIESVEIIFGRRLGGVSAGAGVLVGAGSCRVRLLCVLAGRGVARRITFRLCPIERAM
jgi:hypothetical protein